MKPLNLILDFTEGSKHAREMLDLGGEERLHERERPYFEKKLKNTFLTLDYPNGEHAATFPEVRIPSAGRQAAVRFMKYCDCKFVDKTRE